MTDKMLDEIFTYHAPTPEQQVLYVTIRDTAKGLAVYVQAACPESREKSLAITHLQQAVMFANAAIAIHTPKPPATTEAAAAPTTTAPEYVPGAGATEAEQAAAANAGTEAQVFQAVEPETIQGA